MKLVRLLLLILVSINCNANRKVEKAIPPMAPIFPFVNKDIDKFNSVFRDSNGIPMLLYENEHHYYPIQYTQIALHYYANYVETKNPKSKASFLKIAKFIKENIVYIDDFAVLQYDFIVKPYKLKPPCGSAMSQGFGIGVMIEAYSITKEKIYLDIANKMVKSFGATIEKGGVQSRWGNSIYYEEYADPNSHVLNGYMFSLSGLYYCFKTIGNKEAKKYFDIGIDSLKAKINEYDAAFTSYYSKVNYDQPAYASAINDDPDHYHELEIYQLLTLFVWTKESIFKEYAHKFLKYDTEKVTDFYNVNKFIKIEASSTIEPINYGVDKLDDGLWSYGNYWSTNQKRTDLTIKFNAFNSISSHVVSEESELKNIEAITFYAISEDSSPRNFEIYYLDKDNNWIKYCEAYQLRKRCRNYYKTDNFETFIDTYYFPSIIYAKELRIKFLDFRNDEMVALREINVYFDRTKELDFIEQKAKKNNPLK
jgi:hypothetical protein